MTEENYVEFELDQEQSELIERATTLSEDSRFLAAFHMAAESPELQEIAIMDPLEFLKSHHVEVPKGLTIKFFTELRRGKPDPGYENYTIRWSKCRNVYDKKKNIMEVVCFEIEIVPGKPPGPVG